MTILEQIAEERRAAVKQAQLTTPLRELEALAANRTHHSLAANLRDFSGKCVVAEVKKASPSAGIIRENFDPEAIASLYVEAGAKGISVLTEPNHFMGSREHLLKVRQITELPVLRKDFIVAPYQITETAAWGADVLLLIVAMLDPALIKDLYQQAVKLGLDVIVESHNERELEVAIALPEAILGINNRNLKTLETTLQTSRDLAKMIPKGRISMSESGISSNNDLSELANLGFDGFLIGESLLKGKFALLGLPPHI